MRLAIKTHFPRLSVSSQINKDIVFIHGTGSNSAMWYQQGTFFALRGHRCFLLDLRGHGASAEPYLKADLECHKNDVIQTLEANNVCFPAYFVGHSLGAIISIALAQEKTDWFAAIFAASLPAKVLLPVKLGFELFINGPMQKIKGAGWHKQLSWREKTLIEMTPFTLQEIINNFAQIDLLSKPLQIECPVHFAAGRFDPVAPYWSILKMHRMLPQSTLRTFEWSGHNFMDRRPDAFNQWILDGFEMSRIGAMETLLPNK